MDKLTFILNDKQIEFGINDFKFLLGPNVKVKFEILKALRKTYDNVKISDIIVENNLGKKVLLNDEPINHRKAYYFEVTPYEDFKDLVKTKTKVLTQVLLKKYLESIEYSDSMATIKILLDDFQEEINEKIKINYSDYSTEVKIDELNAKLLLKLISYQMLYQDEDIDATDLDYELTILFQLKWIAELDEFIDEEHIMVYLDLPYLTEKISKLLQSTNWKRTYILVNTPMSFIGDISNVILLNSHKIIDLVSEEEIYEELTMNCTNINTIDDTQKAVIETINKKHLILNTDILP